MKCNFFFYRCCSKIFQKCYSDGIHYKISDILKYAPDRVSEGGRKRKETLKLCRYSRPKVFCKKGILTNSQNSHLKTCARVSGTGVFLWILRYFQEYLFLENISCGFFVKHAIKHLIMKPFYLLNTIPSTRTKTLVNNPLMSKF